MEYMTSLSSVGGHEPGVVFEVSMSRVTVLNLFGDRASFAVVGRSSSSSVAVSAELKSGTLTACSIRSQFEPNAGRIRMF